MRRRSPRGGGGGRGRSCETLSLYNVGHFRLTTVSCVTGRRLFSKKGLTVWGGSTYMRLPTATLLVGGSVGCRLDIGLDRRLVLPLCEEGVGRCWLCLLSGGA